MEERDRRKSQKLHFDKLYFIMLIGRWRRDSGAPVKVGGVGMLLGNVREQLQDLEVAVVCVLVGVRLQHQCQAGHPPLRHGQSLHPHLKRGGHRCTQTPQQKRH